MVMFRLLLGKVCFGYCAFLIAQKSTVSRITPYLLLTCVQNTYFVALTPSLLSLCVFDMPMYQILSSVCILPRHKQHIQIGKA